MTASKPTPPSGESVSDESAQYRNFSEDLLYYALQRSAERLEGEMWETVSQASNGILSREQYQRTIEAFYDFGDVLEFVDRYTHEKQQVASDDSINQSAAGTNTEPAEGGCSNSDT
nr:hypothetical protein [Haloarcula sp. AS7094]